MTVYVKKLGGMAFSIEVTALDTVGVLKAAIEVVTGESTQGQQVWFQSRQLEQNERLVVSYGVTEGSTLILIAP